MATQFSGRAANVANNLPAPVAVTAATNATPIVITTAASHGLHVNDVFTVTGVNGNAAANGTFMAGSVTPTTVALLFYPAGTAVSGSGAYISGGAVQPQTFGVTFPIPNDITDELRAGTVNVALECLGDRTAYLLYQSIVNTPQFTESQYLALSVKDYSAVPAQIETITLTGGFQNSSIVHVDFAQANVGDVIDAWCTFEANANDTNGVHCALALIQDFGGAATVLEMNGADAFLTGDGNRYRIALTAEIAVAVAGPLRVILQYGGTNTMVVKNNGTGSLLAKRIH